MPSLIVSSRYTSDSQLLRHTAQQLGWETFRLDGRRLPDWFDPPDNHIALFYTAPHAFDIAGQLSRSLLGCNPEWTVQLPPEFLLRELRQVQLSEALQLAGKSFVKHSVSKAFPAKVYDSTELAAATAKLLPSALVHVGEPVEWSVEYRCFVNDGDIAAMSPYKRHSEIIEDHSSSLGAPESEVDAARHFAETVLTSPDVDFPPAFVLDVGIIESRGWAVVECNESWASGIYACDPHSVLDSLLRSCVPTDRMTAVDRRWDFKRHYSAACS